MRRASIDFLLKGVGLAWAGFVVRHPHDRGVGVGKYVDPAAWLSPLERALWPRAPSWK